MTFLEELRAAHAVFTAHRAGAHTIRQIAHRTGMQANVCATWVKALRLPVETPRPIHRSPPMARREAERLQFDI